MHLAFNVLFNWSHLSAKRVSKLYLVVQIQGSQSNQGSLVYLHKRYNLPLRRGCGDLPTHNTSPRAPVGAKKYFVKRQFCDCNN